MNAQLEAGETPAVPVNRCAKLTPSLWNEQRRAVVLE
jgi:hypothetical protein